MYKNVRSEDLTAQEKNMSRASVRSKDVTGSEEITGELKYLFNYNGSTAIDLTHAETHYLSK